MRHANLSRETDSFLIIKPASFLINLLLLSITVHDRVELLHIAPTLFFLVDSFPPPHQFLYLESDQSNKLLLGTMDQREMADPCPVASVLKGTHEALANRKSPVSAFE